jgi:hypothetical protein
MRQPDMAFCFKPEVWPPARRGWLLWHGTPCRNIKTLASMHCQARAGYFLSWFSHLFLYFPLLLPLSHSGSL